jgi:hypothetical protein
VALLMVPIIDTHLFVHVHTTSSLLCIASAGQHFSAFAPRGDLQKVGVSLDGLSPDCVELIQLKPRNATGVVDFAEDSLLTRVRERLSTSSGEDGKPVGVAVVHIVCGSKTGLVYPSATTIDQLRKEWGPRVVVVADCCQLRCRLNVLKTAYLAEGAVCLITGSKFFAAPPC